jgi:hypothetical protein
MYDTEPTALLLSEAVVLRIFYRLKNPSNSAMFEQLNLGSNASTLSLDHQGRLYDGRELRAIIRNSLLMSSATVQLNEERQMTN